ncbi:putative g-patch domain-containing protein [Zalerion maritima]|uniref:G-patch domain-containing protein n=1 Tax=Zalerion maritima TaxID=339359 RepID=A0AAD5RZL9_9PEZI|nr:putative g-patch domain-containing protein [Zalerion maritima]
MKGHQNTDQQPGGQHPGQSQNTQHSNQQDLAPTKGAQPSTHQGKAQRKGKNKKKKGKWNRKSKTNPGNQKGGNMDNSIGGQNQHTHDHQSTQRSDTQRSQTQSPSNIHQPAGVFMNPAGTAVHNHGANSRYQPARNAAFNTQAHSQPIFDQNRQLPGPSSWADARGNDEMTRSDRERNMRAMRVWNPQHGAQPPYPNPVSAPSHLFQVNYAPLQCGLPSPQGIAQMQHAEQFYMQPNIGSHSLQPAHNPNTPHSHDHFPTEPDSGFHADGTLRDAASAVSTGKRRMMLALKRGHVFMPKPAYEFVHQNYNLVVRCQGFIFYCHKEVLCKESTFFKNEYPVLYQNAQVSSSRPGAKVMKADMFNPKQLSMAFRFLYHLGKSLSQLVSDGLIESPLESTCLTTNVAMYITGVALGIKNLTDFAHAHLSQVSGKLVHSLVRHGGPSQARLRQKLSEELVRCWQLVFEQPRLFFTHPEMSLVRFDLSWISNMLIPPLLEMDPPAGEVNDGTWTMADAFMNEPWRSLGDQFRAEIAYWADWNILDPAIDLGRFKDKAALDEVKEIFPRGRPNPFARHAEAVPVSVVDNHGTLDGIVALSQPHGSVENGFGSRSNEALPAGPVITHKLASAISPSTQPQSSVADGEKTEDLGSYMVHRYLNEPTNVISSPKETAHVAQADAAPVGFGEDREAAPQTAPKSGHKVSAEGGIHGSGKGGQLPRTEKSTQAIIPPLKSPVDTHDKGTQTDVALSKIKADGTNTEADLAPQTTSPNGDGNTKTGVSASSKNRGKGKKKAVPFSLAPTAEPEPKTTSVETRTELDAGPKPTEPNKTLKTWAEIARNEK